MGKLRYLSPTSFIKALNCQHQVKLIKVDQVFGDEPPDEQSIAMATGTAFDAMCKAALNKRFKLKDILDSEIMPKNKMAIVLAQTIFDEYSKAPLEALKHEGVGYVGADTEVDLEYTDKTGKKWVSGCRGLPDLVMTDGRITDWKVNGAFSSWGATPKPGYIRCFLKQKDLGPHIGSLDFLEKVDQGWAVQTYLYARLFGHKVGSPLMAGIEQVAVTKESDLYFASFRNSISVDFQHWCELEFHKTFHALNNGTTETPHYTKYRCVQYNKLCNVARYCDGYQAFQLGSLGLSGQSVQSSRAVSEGTAVPVSFEGGCFLVKKRPDGVQPDSALPSGSPL